MEIKADLHIHSALSPCASLEMSPRRIVQRAKEEGLDVIAVTDHNQMENAFYTASLGLREGVKVLFGMEAQTREDVHFLCLFEKKRPAERFHGRVNACLPGIANNPDFFGDQVVVDEEENIVRFEPRLLINALTLGVGELVELVYSHGGTIIPSHVESPTFGLMPSLGLVPPELADCMLEISCRSTREEALALYPKIAAHPLITNSDAHAPDEIGKAYTLYKARAGTLSALVAAASLGRCTMVSFRHG